MSPPVYVQNMLKISIGQILQTIGFQTAQSSAIDILVNVLERYIMLLSKGAHDFSELGIFWSFIKKNENYRNTP